MLCFLLIVILIFLFIACSKLFGGLLSPSVQLIGLFIIGLFSFLLYSSQWKADLSGITFLTIFGVLIVFSLGELFASCFKSVPVKISILNSSPSIRREVFKNSTYSFKIIPFVILTAISIATLILYFQYTMYISEIAGNTFGIERMLNYAYLAKTSDLIDCPEEAQYVTFGLVISRCFAYYCIFIVVTNIFKKRTFKNFNIIYFLPILLYLGQAILSGGRTQLIRFVIQILITYLVLLSSNNKSIGVKKNVKAILIIIFSIIAFLAAYRLYGIARLSKNTSLDALLSYPGSAIQALNCYLDNPVYSATFGQETLVTIRGILSKLGLDMPIFKLALPSISWENGSTNIYTAIRRYIADYHYYGLAFITFFLGFFYGLLNRWMIKKRNVISLVIYGMILYPVIEFIFEERFLIGVLSAGTVYMVVAVLFIDRAMKVVDNGQ